MMDKGQYILIIDTSSMQALCAVIYIEDSDTVLCASKSITAKSSHSEKLFIALQDVINDSSISMKEIDTVAYTAGPGSFTGLRISYSAVQGLVLGSNIKSKGVSSLKSLCCNISDFDYYHCAMIKSGKTDVFACIEYNNKIFLEEACYQVEELMEILKKIDNKVMCIGSGASFLSEQLNNIDNVIIPANPILHTISPYGILSQMQNGKKIEGINYLKSSYAEKGGQSARAS